MPIGSLDQNSVPKYGLTEVTKQLLINFETKFKQIDCHLSLFQHQPQDWEYMGVIVSYANQYQFRLMISIEEIEEIVNSDVIPEWFIVMIHAKFSELRAQHSALADRRYSRQLGQNYN